MHYFYAILFAFLVSPIETVVKWFEGVVFHQWVPFNEAIATGALFAYTAILSCDTMIRATLLPHPVRTNCEKTCTCLHMGSLLIFILSLVLFVLLFANHTEEVPIGVHIAASIFALIVLFLTFLALWIDDEGKKGINAHSIKRSAASKKKLAANIAVGTKAP